MQIAGKPQIVVLGMMAKMPVAGVVWQTLHYLIGFERLGYEAYYVEAHGVTPTKSMRKRTDDASQRASAFIDGVMQRFGLGDRWAYDPVYEGDACYGLSRRELRRLYSGAAFLINLHGGTKPLAEHIETGRLVYLETDPVTLQIELEEDTAATVDFLSPHCAFFTFAENYGAPDCKLPISPRFEFKPTRQPVVLDLWARNVQPGGRAFTTIGNWRQSSREVQFEGETYHWSKHHEFLKFLGLPGRTNQQFELALSSSSFLAADRDLLAAHGWLVRDALDFSGDLDAYRDYIWQSRGEFTVAKDQNVRFRSGWFSDRSATYLASAKPVITQETGFSNAIPTGEGLFGFSTLEDILRAVDVVNADYARHCRAAAGIARDYFSSDVVLGRLLSDLGCRVQ